MVGGGVAAQYPRGKHTPLAWASCIPVFPGSESQNRQGFQLKSEGTVVLGTLGLQPNEKGARDSVAPDRPLTPSVHVSEGTEAAGSAWFGPERRSKGEADESQLCWETATASARAWEGRNSRRPGLRELGEGGIRKTPKRSHLGG